MNQHGRDKALNELVEKLFTNGGGHEADRLLLVKEDYRCSAHVTRALDLGGYSREAVKDLLATAISEARAEVWKEAIEIVNAAGEEWGDQARARKSKTYSAYALAALDIKGRFDAALESAANEGVK